MPEYQQIEKYIIFLIKLFVNFSSLCYLCSSKMVVIAQLVRASDCGSEGRGFEPRFPPILLKRQVSCDAVVFFALQLRCCKSN